MANVTVTATTPNVTVDSTNLTVTVAETTSNIVVSQVASVANANIITGLLSVTDTGGDGSLTYDGAGAFTYTGPSAAEVRAHFSNTAPITFSSGVIGIDSAAIFTGKTTDDLAEGSTNKYYSNAKVAAYFSDGANAPFSIGGNLDISGNLNYENVTDLYVTDQKITLNANAATNATVEIIANRPVGNDTKLRWNETSGIWEFTNDGSTFYRLPRNTDELAEGSTNLYYSNAKVDAYLTGGDGIDYSSGTISVDSTVVRTTGNQTVAGVKEFTDVINGTGGIELKGNVSDINMTSFVGANTRPLEFNMNGVEFTHENAGNVTFSSPQTFTVGAGSGGGPADFNRPIAGNKFYNRNGNTTTNVGSVTLDDSSRGATMASDKNINLIFDQNGDATSGAPEFFGIFQGNKDVSSATKLFSMDHTGNANVNQQFEVGTGVGRGVIVGTHGGQGDIKFGIYNSGSVGQASHASLNFDPFTDSGSIHLFANTNNGYIKSNNMSLTGSIQSTSASANTMFTNLIKVKTNSADAITFSNTLITTNLPLTVTGNIETTSNINAAGATLTGVLTSNSDITTTANIQGNYVIADEEFVGDLNGAVRKRVEAGENLSKGDVVYISGGSGDTPTVEKAIASDSSKMPAVGFVIDGTINSGSEGEVATFGLFSGINTSAYTVGTVLYVDPTTAGSFTDVKPTGEANLIQKLGKVIKSGSGSSGKIFVVGAGRANEVSNLDEGNIFLGSSSNKSIAVTPDSNFTTTGNAFSLSNSLTDVNDITSETSSDIQLKAYGNTKINTFIDGNHTEGLSMVPSGRAIKSTVSYRGPNASKTRTGTDVYNGIGIAGSSLSAAFGKQAKIVFTAGSNVVQIYSGYNDNWAAFTESTSIANTYQNGMVLMNTSEISDYQSYTYPLSPKAHTVSLANSSLSYQYTYAPGFTFDAYDANVIMSEVSPVDFTWQGAASSDRGIGMYHTLANSDGDQLMFSNYLGGGYPIGGSGGGNIASYLPVDKNNFIVSDNGNVHNYSSYTAGSLANVGTPLSYSDIAIGTGFPSSTAFRSTKQTTLAPTQGSAKFANIVLIGNNAQYDDTMAGHVYYPSFGINAVWDGIQDLDKDTNPDFDIDAPITTGMRFKQFTDKTIQDSALSTNYQELSTGGARMLLSSANSNVSTNEAYHRPIANQGIGVFGFFGSSQQEVAPRTRSLLPAGMFAVASEQWDANTGTDVYFVSTPQGKKGIDTDNNEAHGFLASQNGETSLFGTNKVSFYQSGNAYSAGNIVGGFNTLKTGTEWANVSSTGITSGATFKGKSFTGTPVALGDRSGDVSSVIDLANGDIFSLRATGGITINTIANAVAGSRLTVIVEQDGTGNHALTSTMKFKGGDKTLSTAGGSFDVIDIFYDGTNYFAELTKAYA